MSTQFKNNFTSDALLTATQHTFHLEVPPRHKPASGSRDIRPKKIEDWINALPLANLGETSRQVYSLLLEINALDITSEDRQRVLEQLRPTTHYIVDALKKHYLGHPFPLSAKNRKVARLAREILSEMALGYKIIVVEVTSKPDARKDGKTLAVALHRALRYIGSTLLKTYQVYDPYPSGIWQELHTLYAIAEQRELHNIIIADHEYTLVDSATVGEAYMQILLLALACPYRLRQGEVEQVEQALERWARYAELFAPHEFENPQALFVINLQGDEPPTYRVLHNQDPLHNCRLLETQGLTQVLRNEMIEAAETTEAHLSFSARDMSPDISRRLMLAWGVIPKRRFTRIKKYAQVRVAMGLSGAYHHISSESVFDPEHTTLSDAASEFQTPASFKSLPTRSDAGKLPEFWELGAAGTIDWKVSPSTQAPPTVENAKNSQRWKMLNISAGGYCLLWDNPDATQAQVGELVCLQETDNQEVNNWGVGVIRWLKSAVGDGLSLGVQMLAPNAVALAVKTSKDNQHFSAYQRCLLLPEINIIQQPATLLLPAMTSQVGATVIIDIHGKEHHARLTKMLENTGTFSQFYFTPLHAQPTTGTEPQSESKDFDSIWSSI